MFSIVTVDPGAVVATPSAVGPYPSGSAARGVLVASSGAPRWSSGLPVGGPVPPVRPRDLTAAAGARTTGFRATGNPSVAFIVQHVSTPGDLPPEGPLS